MIPLFLKWIWYRKFMNLVLLDIKIKENIIQALNQVYVVTYKMNKHLFT